MIRYILGRTGSGKSNFVHKSILEKINSKTEKLFLIVPEQYTLQAELELINDMNVNGIIDIEVMSFNRLCYHVLTEMGGFEEIEVNNLGKAMVLRSILDEHHEELNVFDTISLKTGFIEKLSTLISEFKRVGISSDNLLNQVNSRSKNDIIDRKLTDIALIYDYFNGFMDKGYFDEEDKLLLTLEKLEASKILENSTIYLDGFDSFSAQEIMVINQMVKLSKEVNISLTVDIFAEESSESVFSPVVETMNSIREIAKKHNISERKVTLDRNDYYDDIEMLETEFFSYPYNVYEEEPEHVEMKLCNNYYDEVEQVAIDIQRLVRCGQYRWSDITVISGNLEIYTSIIKRIFSDYEIPFFIDEKVSIVNHPIIKLILSTLACLNSGFKYEDVFKLIKTGFTDVSDSSIEKLENYVLEFGIRGNKWFSDFEYGEDLDILNEVRRSFIAPFVTLKSKIKSKNRVYDLTRVLFEFLVEMNVPTKLESWIEELKNDSALSHVQESTQIWNITLEIFDQLAELEGDDIKTVKEYMRILEAGFNEVKLGIIPPALDQVVIGSIERSKSKQVKAMYIIGLNDGVIPKKFGDEGLILDDEKILLKSEGLDLKTDSMNIMSRDRFSTYVAFSKATQKLHLSYSISDNEGKSLRPSVYVDKFFRVFPKLRLSSHMIENHVLDEVFNPNITFRQMSDNLRLFADDYKIDDKWFQILNWYNNNSEWTANVNSVKTALFHDNQVSEINKSSARSLYDLPLVSSVSRLEKFAQCPFAHFIRYGIKPKDRKNYEIRLPDIGLLFHKTVELFDQKLKDSKKTWHNISKEDSDELVENIVDSLVEDYSYKIFESSSRYKYLIKKLKRVGKRAVWTLVDQVKQGDFEPYGHEIDFSNSGHEYSVKPIVIELKSGERIMLEGRIDRVDITEIDGKKYVKIIDYKSGAQKFSLSEVYHGVQLQLLTYLDAIIQNSEYFRVDELYPAGVFYFKIDDPLLESEVLSGSMTEGELLKKLKMDGMLLKDTSVAFAMDRNIIENKKSDIIPFEIKKDDSISARSKAVDMDSFGELLTYVKETIGELGQEISDGITKIEPTRSNSQTSCQYCDYLSICQFDTSFGNKFKNLISIKDDEVIELIKKKSGGEFDA